MRKKSEFSRAPVVHRDAAQCGLVVREPYHESFIGWVENCNIFGNAILEFDGN